MANSTVSRAQIRSISIENCDSDDPPDRWVKHYARYEYKVQMGLDNKPKKSPLDDEELKIDQNSKLALSAEPVVAGAEKAAPPEEAEVKAGDDTSSDSSGWSDSSNSSESNSEESDSDEEKEEEDSALIETKEGDATASVDDGEEQTKDEGGVKTGLLIRLDSLLS